jgi:hypothetical protein
MCSHFNSCMGVFLHNVVNWWMRDCNGICMKKDGRQRYYWWFGEILHGSEHMHVTTLFLKQHRKNGKFLSKYLPVAWEFWRVSYWITGSLLYAVVSSSAQNSRNCISYAGFSPRTVFFSCQFSFHQYSVISYHFWHVE